MLTFLSPVVGLPVGVLLILLGIWLIIRAYKNRAKATIPSIVNPSGVPTNATKAKTTAEIPASPLTPAVNIVRYEYIVGQPRTMRFEYIASSTDVLLNFQREAKVKIEQDNYKEDISPVSIAPGQFGTIASSAEYRIPAGLSGDIIATPIVTLPDGTQVSNQSYVIHL